MSNGDRQQGNAGKNEWRVEVVGDSSRARSQHSAPPPPTPAALRSWSPLHPVARSALGFRALRSQMPPASSPVRPPTALPTTPARRACGSWNPRTPPCCTSASRCVSMRYVYTVYLRCSVCKRHYWVYVRGQALVAAALVAAALVLVAAAHEGVCEGPSTGGCS